MKTFVTLIVIAFCAILLSAQQANASHAQGGEITYAYTGIPNEYLVTVSFYRDCAGMPAPTAADICYQSASLGFASTVTLYPISGTGNPVVQSSCIVSATNCIGFNGTGTEEWIFQGVVTLPQAATDWIFSYEICCRNNASTNLVNASGLGLYLVSHLNNVDFPTNSSPYFDSIPVATYCLNNQIYYSQGAHDIDNDSLHFSLVGAEDATGFCPHVPFLLPYNTPYSATNPLSTVNGTTIDPLTGVISFIPNMIQVAVICVLVEDFDTTQFPAVKKGSVKREIQVLVTNNCVFVQPTLMGLGTSGGYANALPANCQDTSMVLQLSDPVQCLSIAADGSDFRAIGPDGQPNPIFHAEPVNCINGKADSVRIYFQYPLTQTRTALYIKMGTDGNTLLTECGNSIYATNGLDTITTNDTINIIVQDTSVLDLKVPNVAPCIFTSLTVNLNDQLLCSTLRADASDFKLTDATGLQFPLISAYGNCMGPATTAITVTASQADTGASPFYLIAINGNDSNTVSNLCGTFYNFGDTIAVIDATVSPTISIGPDISQCANLPFPVLDAGTYTGATYLWNTGATTQTIIADSSSTYMVTVTFGSNCTATDETVVELFDDPVSPNLSDQKICYNASFEILNANPLNIQPTSATYIWTDTSGMVVGTAALYTPATPGTYAVTISNNGCTLTDDALVTMEAQLPISLISPQTICGAPIILDAGFTGQVATYYWTKDSLPYGNTQAVSANGGGVYSILTTTAAGCTATASTLIEPGTFATSIIGDQQICETATTTFTASYASAATANFIWTLEGNITGTNSNQLTTNISGTYFILITDQFGCTSTSSAALTVEYVLPPPLAICEIQPTGSAFASIYTWNAIAGALGYEVSLDDGVTWGAANTPQGITSHGVTTPAVEFVVRALGNACPYGLTSATTLCDTEAPNVVTPNNDGLNDTFTIFNLNQFSNVKLSVFNQWGIEVYANENYGAANNYDFKDQPKGTYFYMLSIPGQVGKSGTINLLDK